MKTIKNVLFWLAIVTLLIIIVVLAYRSKDDNYFKEMQQIEKDSAIMNHSKIQ
jgi:hypothetical protein